MAKNKETVSGTCQCCFMVFALRNDKMVHHGYKRPGHGYIVGDCQGVDQKPYELDVEVTKSWLAQVEAYLAKQLASRKALDTATETSKFYPDYTRGYKPGTHERYDVLVTFRKGEKVTDENALRFNFMVTFESVIKDKKWELDRDIEQSIDTVKFLQGRVTAWVYAPEKLVYTKKTAAPIHAPGWRPGDAVCRRAGFRSNAGMNTTTDLTKVTCPKCLASLKATAEKKAKKALDGAKPV